MISGLAFYQILSESIKATMGENALEITQFLSKLPVVRESLKDPEDSIALQNVYEEYLKDTDEGIFLVLVNQNGIRQTHPNPSLIGHRVTGNDIDRALSGEAYYSNANGISGPTLRTWVPITDPDTNEQLGIIAIGYSRDNISSFAERNVDSLIFWLMVAFSIGITAATIFAKQIKRILYNHEPGEIAKLFIEREAMLESLSEGIIAVDQNNKITLINNAAKSILNLPYNIDSKNIYTLLEDFSLLKSPLNNKNLELFVNDTAILANYYPIFQQEKLWGHIITFRDISEVRKLAEDLTGVNQYVDGLRAKTHEFANKLQTLSGLIELKQYDEVKEYISITNLQQQKLLDFLTRNIKEPKISGLLLGKIQQGLELNVNITFTPGSRLKKLPPNIPVDSVALIIGNLLQNAIDAIKEKPSGEINITILDKESKITILVEDNGYGISENKIDLIFNKGYSTKDTAGYGLFLVKHHAENLLKGIVHFSQNNGTSFTVQIPKDIQGSENMEGFQ
ncbi:sensor histidine kinase [Cytobacillus depressus]|uniref:Sensor histidine kinase n=2 Tax=Cytobacillus depressus TaxID=1602942 RepID=A0A6L3V211_9BACI|nr:sensor histidine kinase [Cytobacillus depressus]